MSPTMVEMVELAPASREEAAMDAHVQRVVQSSAFMRAETLRKLLLYLWAHRTDDISEYAVATEALGRRADFDPKTDASVRVQISRLRRKLKDFYELEGGQDGFALHIPMGTHVLIIADGSTPPIAPTVTEMDLPPLPPARNWLVPGLALCCSILMITAVLLGWSLHRVNASAGRTTLSPTSFWTSFVGVDAPVKIILPTPVFFTFPGDDNLHIRDVKVNEFRLWVNSKGISGLAKADGEPRLDHAYTVTSDTLAAIELARYLDRVGLAERVDFGISGDSTMNLLEKSSVVAFGAHATLQPFRDYLASMNFTLGVGESSVHNAQPTQGEQSKYDFSKQADTHQLEPSIVAVLPGRAPGRKLLILQSRHTSALVGMMTSKVGDSMFQKMFEAHGSPAFFEMVVMNESEADHIVRSWPVAMHAYTKNAPNGADVTQ